jgi:hypothetical protein
MPGGVSFRNAALGWRLLSILRSDPMVLDGLQGRYRLAGTPVNPYRTVK